MNCEFIYQDGIYKCQKCGFSFKSDKVLNLQRNCTTSNKPTVVASLLSQAVGVVKGVVNYALGGEVSEEEQKRRLEICQGCDKYIKDSGRCSLCGCVTSIKLRIKNEHCPINKW